MSYRTCFWETPGPSLQPPELYVTQNIPEFFRVRTYRNKTANALGSLILWDEKIAMNNAALWSTELNCDILLEQHKEAPGKSPLISLSSSEARTLESDRHWGCFIDLWLHTVQFGDLVMGSANFGLHYFSHRPGTQHCFCRGTGSLICWNRLGSMLRLDTTFTNPCCTWEKPESSTYAAGAKETAQSNQQDLQIEQYEIL